MSFFSKKKQENILLIDLYQSSLELSFIYKDNDKCRAVSVRESLDYLRVADPKEQLQTESLRSAVQRAAEKLNKKLHKINTGDFEILVLPHGKLSLMQNDELYVQLKDKGKLSEETIANIVQKHHLDQDSFKNLIDNKDDGKMFFKSRKLITRIAPNFYLSKSWRKSGALELSFLVTQILVREDIHKPLQEELFGIYPGKTLSFINPNALLATALSSSQKSRGLNSNFNILDLGAEFISFYQIYDGFAINSGILNLGVNQVIRKLDTFIESFELSESALKNYLKGHCKGDDCKKIKSLLNEFENQLKESLSKIKLNPFLKSKIILMHNPDLNKEIVLWLSHVFGKALGDKMKIELNTQKNTKDAIRQYFCINRLIHDKDKKLIIFD